jgi:hypothetical protein
MTNGTNVNNLYVFLSHHKKSIGKIKRHFS